MSVNMALHRDEAGLTCPYCQTLNPLTATYCHAAKCGRLLGLYLPKAKR